MKQTPKGVARSLRRTDALSVELQDRELHCSTSTTRNSFGRLRIIVNEKHINLEKTTSVILINLLEHLTSTYVMGHTTLRAPPPKPDSEHFIFVFFSQRVTWGGGTLFFDSRFKNVFYQISFLLNI